MLAGITLADLMEDLHPTPAVAGTPVGEAKMQMCIRDRKEPSRLVKSGLNGEILNI